MQVCHSNIDQARTRVLYEKKQAEKLKSREMKVEGGGDVEKLILWGFGS